MTCSEATTGPVPGMVEAAVIDVRQIDLAATMSLFRYGSGDPTYVEAASGIWRTFSTPEGAATARFRRDGDQIRISAWGTGAGWVAEHAGEIVGATDDPRGFTPDSALLRRLSKQFSGLRFTRTGLVLDSLLPAVLSQKITGKEAFAWWRRLVTTYGSPAPGPTPRPMWLPPTVQALRAITSWQWHRLGVGPAHQRTLRRVAAVAPSLERLSDRPIDEAAAALQSVPGIGRWTVAEVASRAWGSADHPSFGDYHLATSVGIAMTGQPVDDDEMEQLLERYRPHRTRVTRLIELAGIGAERHGPRRTVPDFRDI